ncbi:putative phytanoyl-CoA dioxygenase [Dendronephthya gigantea]|uniref:putative phytanoyl-CoA dioxygenase n=1 Tax=Dendronephthya gigantea TaxID=151771 RepID=UPI00106B5A4A|nr:putative phytanoyl-CoA dioxygenase [Dendronephthya gigantea]
MAATLAHKMFSNVRDRGTTIGVKAFMMIRTAASTSSSAKVKSGGEYSLGNNDVSWKTKPRNELNVTANSPSWIHQLNTHGYAVVPNVLSSQECDHIIEQAWEWLFKLGTGINRGDPKTWTNERWPSNFNGIIQRYRIGHAPFIWKARTNPNVIGVFKEIWGTGELLTSFDAMCILRPAEMVEDLEYTQSWFHTDQSPKKKGFHCVQGVLNLEEAFTEDAGFACYPGSHSLHQELFQRNNEYNSEMDFNIISKDDLEWVEHNKGLVPTRIPAPKGSFVVFDSRLLHCNVPANVPRQNPRWRYTLYICMTPRAWADQNTLQARVKAFRNQQMTTHWPHHLGLFPDDPDFPMLPKFDLGDVGEKLVGLKDYSGNKLVLKDGVESESGFKPHDRPAL